MHISSYLLMTDHINRLLVRELQTFVAEVQLFPDNSLLWVCPDGISNSAGNLAKHVAGNLRHFVGHILGETSYVRDREAEFGARSGTRESVVAELLATISDVDKVLPRLTRQQLEAPYPIVFGDASISTERFLFHLCSHAALHLGQAGYLRRILTGQNRSSGVTPIPALVD